MTYTLQNEYISLTADTAGAELVSVTAGGRERLWQNENGSWGKHAPLLFPVCGHCEMKVNGAVYPLSAHGFAAKREFLLLRRTDTSLCFVLCADDETKKQYPFDFTFTVTYALHGNALTITYEVENSAAAPLPYACGGHESFALASDVGDYKIVFEKKEQLVHRFHDDDGFLTGQTEEYGNTRELVLPADFLTDGKTLIFPRIKSRAVSLCRVSGEKEADILFPDFENLLLWRPHGARMICIEPWMNLPDTQGEHKEFAEKEGVRFVPPQSRATVTRTIRYY